MKKTLAAVLAAAMALSTATVALATDIRGDADFEVGDLLGGTTYTAKMGDTSKYILDNIDMDNGSVISGSQLAWAIKEGYLTPSVVVTSNQNKLDGRPALNTGKTNTNLVVGDKDVTTRYYFDKDVVGAPWAGDPVIYRKGKELTSGTFVYDYNTATGNFMLVGNDAAIVDHDKGANFEIFDLSKGDTIIIDGTRYTWKQVVEDALQSVLLDDRWSGTLNSVLSPYSEATGDKEYATNDALRLSFKINHTYGIDSVTVKMKLRFTVKKLPKDASSLVLGGKDYFKGDTITSEELSFEAKYNELSNYYEDMQLTSTEVSNNNVILNGANLYDAIGAKNFSISFGDDVAVFTAKAAANQKKVNLYWSLAEIDEIKDQYPDVDFTFLTFKGNPSPVFQNTGTMYFAAEDKDYQVYSWDGEVLEPLTGKFDSTYKVIEVKGIKKLGTYVIADQILEVEEEPEEPAEPVDSTPVAEPDDDEGQNPNTGAC